MTNRAEWEIARGIVACKRCDIVSRKPVWLHPTLPEMATGQCENCGALMAIGEVIRTYS